MEELVASLATVTDYVAAHKSFADFANGCIDRAGAVFAILSPDAGDDCAPRLATTEERVQESYAMGSKLWKRLWSNLVVDHAPWDPAGLTGNVTKPRWKRDNSLFAYSCPFRMKRNRNYSSHIEASIHRDSGNFSTAEQKVKEHKERLMAEYRESAPPELFELPEVHSRPAASRATDGRAAKFVASFACELVKVKSTRPGTLAVYDQSVQIALPKAKKTYTLEYADMARVLRRRRFHHGTAIEIFMTSGRAYFVNCPEYRSADVIRAMNLPDGVFVQRQEFLGVMQGLPFTQQWVSGQISNFEYIMLVNTFAGRSFNDVSQYPFVPWVLSDYTSQTIDLSSRAVYRNLARPIGAVGEERFAELKRRMADMMKLKARGYLYSSFAICPLAVYLWLLRIEPFTAMHILMQSGRFDHPSRLFSSIPETWRLVSTQLSDYRELPPEFYFQGEFAHNDNDLDLGQFQGRSLGEVILPPWANGSGLEFCYIMRKAFESDYTSEHLSEWIDLFFGYAQTDQEALVTYNLYLPDMYESAWTQETLSNPMRRAEIEAVMTHVGQLPPKIFAQQHPVRRIKKPVSAVPQIVNVDLQIGAITTSGWRSGDKNELILFGDRRLMFYSVDAASATLITPGPSVETATVIANLCWLRPSSVIGRMETGELVSSDGGSLTVIHPELGAVCSVASSGEYLVVAAHDATLNMFGPRLKYAVPLYGDSILCCAVSRAFGLAVCGTTSGKIVLCSLFDGTKLCSVALDGGYIPERVLITDSWGFIVTYAELNVSGKTSHSIFLHNVNGRFIRSISISFCVTAWCTWATPKGFDYLLVANELGKLSACEAFFLRIDDPFHRCSETVVSLHYSTDLGAAVAVVKNGHVVFIPFVV
jgi:hypothetical protein